MLRGSRQRLKEIQVDPKITLGDTEVNITYNLWYNLQEVSGPTKPANNWFIFFSLLTLPPHPPTHKRVYSGAK